MERLTKRTAANGIILTGIFTSATYDTPEEVRQLLADYEDTGLTPERCAELAAADGVPVIHAHWTNKKEKWHDGEAYCSACGAEAGAEYGRYTYLETEYCPQCGARMDEQEET